MVILLVAQADPVVVVGQQQDDASPVACVACVGKTVGSCG
jgi:hypothetical protein